MPLTACTVAGKEDWEGPAGYDRHSRAYGEAARQGPGTGDRVRGSTDSLKQEPGSTFRKKIIAGAHLRLLMVSGLFCVPYVYICAYVYTIHIVYIYI